MSEPAWGVTFGSPAPLSLAELPGPPYVPGGNSFCFDCKLRERWQRCPDCRLTAYEEAQIAAKYGKGTSVRVPEGKHAVIVDDNLKPRRWDGFLLRRGYARIF
jgi:hypothetical protein